MKKAQRKKNESLLREHQPSGITVPNRFPFTSWFVCSPAISPIVSIHWAAAVDFTTAGARNRSRSLSAEKKRFLIPRTQSRDVRKWCEAIKIPPMQASLPFGMFMANEQRPDTLRPTKRKEYLNFEGGSNTRSGWLQGRLHGWVSKRRGNSKERARVHCQTNLWRHVGGGAGMMAVALWVWEQSPALCDASPCAIRSAVLTN